jgi:hypothetical protein
MTMRVDLLALWAWEYDEIFMHMLRDACRMRRVDALFLGGASGIDVDALHDLAHRLDAETLLVRALLDRVWDWGDEYEAHVDAARRRVPRIVNPYERVRAIWDRAHVHYLLMRHGIHVPYMIQLPPWVEAPDIAPMDLSVMHRGLFSVKGVFSGGSGVLPAAATWGDVLERRRAWPDDRTLVQEWIEPRTFDGQRAWFRVFYACGAALPCWQDDRTHVQTAVSERDVRRFGLEPLYALTQQIAGVCGLNLFSTEIARDVDGRWVVVDYVNDPCDFRPQSSSSNGVPDAVLETIVARIAGWAARR